MILGTIGMIMIGLGVVRYFTLMYDVQGFGLTLIGFAIINSYIFYLEKKAGISNRIVWIQSIICMLTLGAISYFLYL